MEKEPVLMDNVLILRLIHIIQLTVLKMIMNMMKLLMSWDLVYVVLIVTVQVKEYVSMEHVKISIQIVLIMITITMNQQILKDLAYVIIIAIVKEKEHVSKEFVKNP
jgi:hypothetical protein